MANLSELYSTIRTALVGDATLVALLSSATAVYQEGSADVTLAPPCILMRIIKTHPRFHVDGAGRFNPGIRLKILAQSADRCREIEARLNAILDIPRTVTASLSGAAYRIDVMYQVDSIEGTGWMANDQGNLSTLETVWNCSVKPIS